MGGSVARCLQHRCGVRCRCLRSPVTSAGLPTSCRRRTSRHRTACRCRAGHSDLMPETPAGEGECDVKIDDGAYPSRWAPIRSERRHDSDHQFVYAFGEHPRCVVHRLPGPRPRIAISVPHLFLLHAPHSGRMIEIGNRPARTRETVLEKHHGDHHDQRRNEHLLK